MRGPEKDPTNLDKINANSETIQKIFQYLGRNEVPLLHFNIVPLIPNLEHF